MTETILSPFELPPAMERMLSLALGQLPRELPEGEDWRAFLALVEKNRVTPLIAHSLSRLPSQMVERMPELRAIRDSKNSYALICMKQLQVLSSLTESFRERGLRVISMKGPVLAMELYGDPSLRFSRDLDLLVPGEEFDKACALLEELGFEPEVTLWNKTPLRRRLLEKRGEEMHRCYRKDDICIELHWRLSFRSQENFEELWSRRQEKPLMGRTLSCLGRDDEVPYLITHAAGHGYQRLRWLLDIHKLQQDDPGFFPGAYETMAARGTGMLLIETMLLLYRLGLPMEDVAGEKFSVHAGEKEIRFSFCAEIREDARRGMELADAVWPLLTLDRDAQGMAGRNYQRMLPTLGRKRTVLDVLSPCGADLRLIDLPDRWFFLYYLIRPLHKLWRLLTRNES